MYSNWRIRCTELPDYTYCLSDIEDGIEKNLISIETLEKELVSFWIKNKEKNESDSDELLNIFQNAKENSSLYSTFISFRTRLIRNLVSYAADVFISDFENIKNGARSVPIIAKDTEKARWLSTLKTLAINKLYRSEHVVNTELTGFRVIEGILEHHQCLLELTRSCFKGALNGERSGPRDVNLDLSLRLISKIPQNYITLYEKAADNNTLKESLDDDSWEWLQRAHLIVDYISSMTDNFALSTFQYLDGNRLS